MANKIKQTLKNYWFLWTTIGVGIVGLALQLFGNACFRVPAPDGLNTLVPTVTCPMRDYVVPITIISVLAIVIAPYVLSTIGIPLLMGGMILIPAICIGGVIGLVYKSYCAIKKKK